MGILISLFIVVALLAGHSPADELSWDGYQHISFGTRLEDLPVNSAIEWDAKQPQVEWQEDCQILADKKLDSVYYMVEEGVITRVDVPVSTATSLGINTAASIEQLSAEHADVVIQNHKYVEAGHTLIFYNKDASKALLLEYYAGKVQAMRAGLVPAVLYVEGCL